MKKFFTFSIIFIGVMFLPSFVSAQEISHEGASVFLSPATGTFYVGSTFNVSVFINTSDRDVNTVKTDLGFNPKNLQVVNPTAGRSFFSIWITQPTYSNLEGFLSFQGGLPSPGINTSSGLVSTITFRATQIGDAAISVLDSSGIFMNDGQGTDILTNLGRGVYRIIPLPPEGPIVSSPTHPDSSSWYQDSSPVFEWKSEDGIEFSYSIDKDFRATPDDVSEGSRSYFSYNNLEDGVWYFHIKAKKNNEWGGVTHFPVMIDSTPPADFSFSLSSFLAATDSDKQSMISFSTTDNFSGVDHYELKITNPELKEESFFIEVESPYRLNLEEGRYGLTIRAYDKSGNYREISDFIKIGGFKEILIDKKGIDFFFVFIPWYVFLLFVGLVLVVFWFICFIGRKYKIVRNNKGKPETDLERK